jgi:hypothetical protein
MILEKRTTNDGTYLRKRFAYDHFKEKTQSIGNIIAFRSQVHIDVENIVDKDKIINDEPIRSCDAVNFYMEIPGRSLFSGICYHRLFNSCIATILASEFLKCDIEVDGADIIMHKEVESEGIIRKYGNISINDANEVDGAVLLFTGIHINAGQNAPITASSTHLTDDQATILMRKGIELFYSSMQEIFVETTKKAS